MSQKNIDINELNNFNFQLGPSVSNQPEQQLPELYFTATAPVLFGRSFFNNWQTLTAPITPNTLAGAEQERYGIMPDTTLASIANLENWTGKKPNVDDFWEYRKANYLLTGGAGSGFLGRDVDLYALERAKHGYWSGPYFKMQNPLLENMDQMELAYNDYLQNLKTAKQEVKNNLGIDGEPIAYYDDAGIPRTKDGKLAFSSNGDIKIKYDGKEIPSHEVPEPMSLEQFKARTKAFNDAGAISRWMLSTQAEGGYLSGNALVGALVDTAFDNPLYSNNLDDEYAKESAIKLSLAKYNSGLDIFEQGVGTIASDIKELIDKKESNFDGSTWFDNLSLPKEVKESLASKGISSIDFIGTNNKNHALFILQDKLFKRTLQEKIESYENNSSIFDNSVIGFGADLFTIAVNDPDLGIGIAATAATAGIGGLAKSGQMALSATKYANKARVLQRTLQLAQTGVKAAAALSTGELPSFMHKLSHLKRIGYIGSVGAGLNMVANAKDQSTRIAMSMTGLQTDHQFEYSKSELAVAGLVGFGFGTTVYGATQGLGKLKTKLFKKDTTTGSVRLETPEGTDATVIIPTPITKDAIDETIATAVASTETTTPTTTTPVIEPIKTVDLELEGTKYKFREDDLRKIEPTAERNTVENIYIQREDGVYEIPKLSLDEAKLRAIEVKDLPPITGESKTRLERIASDAEKASDSATIKEDGRTGTLGIAPESPIFSRVVGESTLDYGQRSIDSNQVADEKDWTRLVATKEEIQAIQAEPKAYNKIRKLRDISTKAIDVLKQLRESGRTSKDSTWFTDQEINLNRHIADLQKLEYDLIGREHKGFTTLTPQNKTKFLELAEKYKALPKEEFDAKINEEKNLNRKFRKALKDYIYGKEPKAETLKIKPTDSPLVKKLKETTNSVLAKRKTKPRSLNASQTKKAQKAFIDLDYGRSISEEHNRLITYFENELNRVNLPSQVIKDATKLLSASLVNLKLNPAKLIKYLDMSTRKGIFGQTEPTRVGENFIFGLKLDELNLTDLTPAEVSQAATRIALHELGHIYSFVLDVNQQIDLYKAYSDNVDLDLLRHLTSVDERFQKSGVESESAYYLSNAAEFFANMFDSLVFTRTVEAISKLENQSLFTKLMLPFFKYIKDVASKLVKNFSKSAFRDLDDTISEMIEVADLVSERSSTDSASLGVISFEAQKLLPKDTIAFDGLLSYRNYLDTVSETLFTKASKTNNQAGLKLGDIVADLAISDKSIIKVQSELLNKLNKFTDAELEEVTKLIPNYDQFKELFVDFTDDNRTQNLLTVVAYLMPNRIEEVMAAIHTTVGSTISSKLQGFISEEISSAFEDIAETADTYKAKSLAYTIPTLFEDYTSIEDMYKNNQSIVSLLRDIKDNPKLEQNIPFIKLKMPNVADTIGGGYLNQFVFLDDILQNISDTTGLSLDNILTSNQIYGELDRVTMSYILNNPQIIRKALIDGTQQHSITNFETLVSTLMDVTTEKSIIKYLLETYWKDTEIGKVFSLQPVFQRLETDKAFETQLLNAAKENPTVDGFAKTISSILVEEKKKKIKKERKLKEKVVEEPTKIKLKEQPKQEEVKVTTEDIVEDLTTAKTIDDIVEMMGKKKSTLRSKLVTKLKQNWSGIKTVTPDDIINSAIMTILQKRTELNAALDKSSTAAERTNIIFSYVMNQARSEAQKQKRKAQKVSYGLVTKEGEDIDVADARIAIEEAKPVSEAQAKALQAIIPQTNLSEKVKDVASNYATAKRNNPEMSDKAIASLIGVTDKQLQNAKAALKKQVAQIDGEIKLVNDEARPTTKKEVIVETSRSQAAKQTDKILTGKEKPKVVSLEEARAKLEQARNIRTNVQAATSPVVKELPAAMPEVQTKTGDEVMFVSGETKDESVKTGSILVPENKAMLVEQQTELPAVSSVIVTREIRSLNLPVVKNNIIDSITSAPEELFSDLGIEKELLLEVLRESKTPEVDLINILKESNIQLIKLTKEDTTVAAIPTTDEAVKKVVTMDTGSRLPTIRKPINPPVIDDPKIVVDKPVADPEKIPVEMDPRTGRAPATEPKIKKGIAETVVLSDVDKFDAQMMAGESLLRNSGTDPKFIKVLLLNFHRVTAGLRENLGKKVETLPDQFLHFLDKVYNIYATISNINQEKFGTRFEAINNIFWEYYDIELAKELDARSTPAEQISVKILDQILEFAKAKTDQAIDSYNKRYGTNLPEFTRPPSPHDFIFSSKDITLRYPDKMGMKKGSYAAVTYAGAKTPIDVATVTRDLGLGVVVDLTPEKLPPTQGILLNFLNNLATEHTEVFRSTNFIARWFRGSEKENRNAFRKALNFITGLTSLATGESKTLYSMNNLLRWLSSMAESGKVMTHQLVKSGTHAFKTWEGAAHQVQRSKTALIKLNRELAIQTGDLRVMQKVELEIVKSLVATKRQLQRTDIETAVIAINPAAQPAYIDAVFNAAKNLRDETIRRNKFILDLENSTEWISIKDDAGNPIPAENYFALTFDRNKVTKNDRSQIVDEMVRVRKDTIKNDETLDRSIMLSMGWLWDSNGNPLTTRGKEGRDQLHVGETGFDVDTLSRLEAKAGNRRYAPGTDLKRIPEIRKEADTKFFSYVDPATAQVVICAIPEKVSDLSPRDLARYMETVDGSTAHIAEQWKDNYGNTKPVLQVMMEELLAFKLREGNYHRYIQKPEMGDNAFLQLFGKGGDNQGFAVKNLNWKETFNSPLILDIIRTNPLEAYDNLINHRGFELLIQAELDRMLGHKGIRIYEVFDAASKLLMRMAGSNEKLQKDLQGGMQRLAEDYAEYAGRNPRIQSAYGEAGEQLSRAAGGIIRATSGQRWGLRSTAESFVNIIASLPEVGTKETINNLFSAFKLLIDRKPSSALKQELFLTVHGIRSYLTDIEDRYLPTGAVSGVPSLNDSWWKRATKSKEDSWKAVAAIEKFGSLGVELGSVKYITAASKHFAMVRFVHRNAKYIMSGAALRLTALMENPINKAELERLQALSVTSEKADKQLSALQKKLAREAGFGGNWDHALTFMRFRLLDPDKLKALKYILDQTGINKNGIVNLSALQAKVDAYMTGPIGPVSKEVLDEAFNDFMYAIETQITTNGMISESRGLNRDISFSSRTAFGKLASSLLQWSQSFHSNVLRNLQLKKPTVIMAELVVAYSAFTYLSELILDWLNGRDVSDIKEELKDPSTSVYRMASTLPVFGSLSGPFSSGLAMMSQLYGGTFKGFNNPITPPAFGVLTAYGTKALGSTKDLLSRSGEMSPEEIVAKFGDIIPFNITMNNSPIAMPARLLEQMGVISEQDAFGRYLDLIQKGNNKYIEDRKVANYNRVAPMGSKEIEKQLRASRDSLLEQTNQMIESRKKMGKKPVIFRNKGVSTDLANLLEDMSNNQ